MFYQDQEISTSRKVTPALSSQVKEYHQIIIDVFNAEVQELIHDYFEKVFSETDKDAAVKLARARINTSFKSRYGEIIANFLLDYINRIDEKFQSRAEFVGKKHKIDTPITYIGQHEREASKKRRLSEEKIKNSKLLQAIDKAERLLSLKKTDLIDYMEANVNVKCIKELREAKTATQAMEKNVFRLPSRLYEDLFVGHFKTTQKSGVDFRNEQLQRYPEVPSFISNKNGSDLQSDDPTIHAILDARVNLHSDDKTVEKIQSSHESFLKVVETSKALQDSAEHVVLFYQDVVLHVQEDLAKVQHLVRKHFRKSVTKENRDTILNQLASDPNLAKFKDRYGEEVLKSALKKYWNGDSGVGADDYPHIVRGVLENKSNLRARLLAKHPGIVDFIYTVSQNPNLSEDIAIRLGLTFKFSEIGLSIYGSLLTEKDKKNGNERYDPNGGQRKQIGDSLAQVASMAVDNLDPATMESLTPLSTKVKEYVEEVQTELYNAAERFMQKLKERYESKPDKQSKFNAAEKGLKLLNGETEDVKQTRSKSKAERMEDFNQYLKSDEAKSIFNKCASKTKAKLGVIKRNMDCFFKRIKGRILNKTTEAKDDLTSINQAVKTESKKSEYKSKPVTVGEAVTNTITKQFDSATMSLSTHRNAIFAQAHSSASVDESLAALTSPIIVAGA